MARPGSGTASRGSPWRWRRVTYEARSRRTTAGWLLRGWEGRRLGRRRGPGVSDAPPRHARQPLRGDAERRVIRRRMSAPTAGWWRPAMGTASASGRPTRAASWPISRPVTATPCCFTPTAEASSARQVGLVPLADPARSRRRADAIRVGPPELLRRTGGGLGQGDLAARSSDSGADRQRQRPSLAHRFQPSPPGLEPGNGPRQRGESPHDHGRRQPGRPLAGGRRLERGRGSGLGPAPAPARAHLETEGARRRPELLRRLQPRRPLAGFVHGPRCGRALTTSGAWGPGSWIFGSTRSATGTRATPGVHRRRPADGPGDRARSGVAGRRRHGTRAGTADDIAAGDPDTARLQPRRHEADRQDEPEDRAGLGPAADP